MYRIDNNTAGTGAIPTPGPVGPNVDGHFLHGLTEVDADLLNAEMEEMCYFIEQSPGSPTLDKTDRTQLKTALDAYINASIAGSLNVNDMIHVRDEKANTTTGGNFTQDAWQIRTLNTEKTNTISGASLATNKITLPAGDYRIIASAPAHSVNNHKAKLWNATTNADIIIGTNSQASNGSSTQTDSDVEGNFTLAGVTDLELHHYCQVTNANGFGQPSSFGVIEVYADVKIYKVG